MKVGSDTGYCDANGRMIQIGSEVKLRGKHGVINPWGSVTVGDKKVRMGEIRREEIEVISEPLPIPEEPKKKKIFDPTEWNETSKEAIEAEKVAMAKTEGEMWDEDFATLFHDCDGLSRAQLAEVRRVIGITKKAQNLADDGCDVTVCYNLRILNRK